ncbi:hypothetical protein [Sphingobium estronivorans]|uniref:hypothetical protein n=1 Tax=Sphingobium estronivorans TaxID=1577690 RepID=UPI00123B2BA6|nr:hypothetical protein [Sphingobium estronivorans]
MRDQSRTVSHETAWAALRSFVLAETGIDLERKNAFGIVVRPIDNSGMSAIICGPRSAPDAATLAANSFISIFGDLAPEFAEAAAMIELLGGEVAFCSRVDGKRPQLEYSEMPILN